MDDEMHRIPKFSFDVTWEDPHPPKRNACWRLSLYEDDKEVDVRWYGLFLDDTEFSEKEMLDEVRERGTNWVAAQYKDERPWGSR